MTLTQEATAYLATVDELRAEGLEPTWAPEWDAHGRTWLRLMARRERLARRAVLDGGVDSRIVVISTAGSAR